MGYFGDNLKLFLTFGFALPSISMDDNTIRLHYMHCLPLFHLEVQQYFPKNLINHNLLQQHFSDMDLPVYYY